MVNHLSRLATRFYGDEAQSARSRSHRNKVAAREALEAGLVTSAPDDLDWETKFARPSNPAPRNRPTRSWLEANLRFGPPESSKPAFFGRLSACRTGSSFAPRCGNKRCLKVYGTGAP